jgi:hypothetical protein
LDPARGYYRARQLQARQISIFSQSLSSMRRSTSVTSPALACNETPAVPTTFHTVEMGSQ